MIRNPRVSFRVDRGQYLSVVHAQQDDPLLAIGSPVIDPLDGERIAARGSRLGEADAVVA
jgi:hypothetical protein